MNRHVIGHLHPVPSFRPDGMRKRGECGFTLLELTISISMLVIIVMIVSGAMRLASRSMSSGEQKVQAQERLRTSLSVINAQIQSAAPLVYDDEGTEKSYFRGNRESLQLSTNYSIWGGQKGYVVVGYQVQTDLSGKRSLHATEHMVGLETSRETTLLEGFDDIAFQYFLKGRMAGEPDGWVSDFTPESPIPLKVRLYLLSGSKERSIILPVRARPLAGGV
jgi:general secretion pathway protein J